jgi:hypothetical protein
MTEKKEKSCELCKNTFTGGNGSKFCKVCRDLLSGGKLDKERPSYG